MSDSRETERPARILVVDDRPDTGRTIRDWFKGEPFEVLVAGGGREGLQMARSERPDIILLDLTMPDMDGFDVARELRADPATEQIPVVMLTARREKESKVRAFAAGVDDYVTKPFELEEIDARVRSILRKHRMVRTLESKVADLSLTKKELEALLVVDEKTGLHTFREFQRRLKAEWERAHRYGHALSLVMFDLDHFKKVNDTRGHPAGDQVLREFATLMVGGARANDVAARYGGEEFAMILPHTDGAMAFRVAERIRNAVREFVFLEDENPAHITVSAGVATYPSFADVDSVDALVRAADMALYEAKARGRDRVVQDDANRRARLGRGTPRSTNDPPTR